MASAGTLRTKAGSAVIEHPPSSSGDCMALSHIRTETPNLSDLTSQHRPPARNVELVGSVTLSPLSPQPRPAHMTQLPVCDTNIGGRKSTTPPRARGQECGRADVKACPSSEEMGWEGLPAEPLSQPDLRELR